MVGSKCFQDNNSLPMVTRLRATKADRGLIGPRRDKTDRRAEGRACWAILVLVRFTSALASASASASTSA